MKLRSILSYSIFIEVSDKVEKLSHAALSSPFWTKLYEDIPYVVKFRAKFSLRGNVDKYLRPACGFIHIYTTFSE